VCISTDLIVNGHTILTEFCTTRSLLYNSSTIFMTETTLSEKNLKYRRVAENNMEFSHIIPFITACRRVQLNIQKLETGIIHHTQKPTRIPFTNKIKLT
jgi:hypothetical protein